MSFFVGFNYICVIILFQYETPSLATVVQDAMEKCTTTLVTIRALSSALNQIH